MITRKIKRWYTSTHACSQMNREPVHIPSVAPTFEYTLIKRERLCKSKEYQIIIKYQSFRTRINADKVHGNMCENKTTLKWQC